MTAMAEISLRAEEQSIENDIYKTAGRPRLFLVYEGLDHVMTAVCNI